MSQTTIPFQPGQVIEDEAIAAEPESAGRDMRLLLVLGAVGVLALLAAVYFLVFAGGDGSESGAAKVPHAAPVVPVAPASAAPAPAVKSGVSKRSFGRDPFKPLIADSQPDVSTPAAGTTDAAPTGSTSVANAPVTPAAPVAPAAPAASTPHRFQVSDVAADNKTIDVKVDGKSYKSLRAGEVFAQIFKVRFIGGPSNSFQIGDETFNVVGAKAVTISG